MFVELLKDFLGQPAGARIDVSETDARALIEGGTARAVEGDPLAEVISRALADALGKMTQGLQRSVDTALKEFSEAQALSRKNRVPRIFGDAGQGDSKQTFGQFLLAVRKGDHKTLEAMGSRFNPWDSESKAALTSSDGTQGGYTVPPQFLDRLLQLTSEMSVVESRATRIPMTSRSVHVPALDVETAPSAGDTAFFGGLKAVWTEEAQSITETEPTFRQVELVAHELSGYSLSSNTLLADNAIGLEALLMQLFSRAIAWYKDYAFLRGNGVGKPLGVLNAASLISVSRSAGSAFALADAAGMLARLLPGYDPMHTVWAIHPTVLAQLFQMSDAEGNIIFIDNARARPTMILFGLPVEVSEKLPALNTLGDVLLMDLRHYLVGDRQDIEIAFSEHVKFLTNQGAWRFVARCDGQPWMRSAITLSDASSTLSPFVGLAAG
jgi:HK97 family phage major capsid protein